MLTFIYIFFENGEKKKPSVTHYKKDLDNDLLHSTAKGDEISLWQVKFLKQKQNHHYLKTCTWVVLFYFPEVKEATTTSQELDHSSHLFMMHTL